MKLATYRDGSRDGQLMVVSRDLSRAHFASHIATRLQAVLDDWNFMSPQLEDLSTALNQGQARHPFPFEPSLCMAPLPRAFQCVFGGTAGPQCLTGDAFSAAAGVLPVSQLDADGDVDCEPGLMAFLGDLPQGAEREQALSAVRLYALALCAQPRQAPPLSQPRLAFSPMAVTPDEWRQGLARPSAAVASAGAPGPRGASARSSAALEGVARWSRSAAGVGEPELRQAPLDAAQERALAKLLVESARRRPLGAGSVFGVGLPAEGSPEKGWRLPRGDSVRLEMLLPSGHSLFGALSAAWPEA